MCTATFLPGKESIYFTSSRNEGILENPTLFPEIHDFSSGKVVYPKGSNTAGTWIAGHENGNVVMFLNGAFEPHQPRAQYRKSQGLILLDLIDHVTPLNCFLAVNLNNIEPFTAIIRDNGFHFFCRWDGTSKVHEEIDADTPGIWTSVIHSDEESRKKQETRFTDFLEKHPYPSQEDVLHFHQSLGQGDIVHSQVTSGNTSAGGGSITSIEMTNGILKMLYLDLSNNERFSEQIRFDSSAADR